MSEALKQIPTWRVPFEGLGENRLPRDASAAVPFELGEWQVYPALNRISSKGKTVSLEPRMMHVLVCLASCPGVVLSRMKLLETAWPGLVVGEEALTRVISRLRVLLRDEPKSARFIETIRGSGYRLTAPVSPLPESDLALLKAPPNRTGTYWQKFPLAIGKKRWVIGIFAFLALVLAFLDATKFGRGTLKHLPREVHLTVFPEQETCPAFSPDGILVAFSHDRDGPGDFDIFVTDRKGCAPRRLTDSAHKDLYPSWSPNGDTLAFVRHDKQDGGIYAIAVSGGEETRLFAGSAFGPGLDWSHDGSQIVFSAPKKNFDGNCLYLLDLARLEVEVLTEPGFSVAKTPPFDAGDGYPVWSPNGKELAFSRSIAPSQQNLCVLDMASREIQILGSGWRHVSGLIWDVDGKYLITSAERDGRPLLWRVNIADGSFDWVPTSLEGALHPDLDPTGERLVFVHRQEVRDIWQFEPSDDDPSALVRKPVIVSTKNDACPAFSPDRERVAFVSNRSGHRQLWCCLNDGTQMRQLTDFSQREPLEPRWSPDGHWIAFSASGNENLVVYVLHETSGQIKPVSPREGFHTLISWSGDSQWVFFDSGESRLWDLKKVRKDGTRLQSVSLTHDDLDEVRLFDDHIYYTRVDTSGIWAWPQAGGESTLVIPGEVEESWVSWTVNEAGIYFLIQGGDMLEYGILDAPSYRESTTRVKVPSDIKRMSFSRDGQAFLSSMVERVETDVALIEAFRN